MTFISGNLNDVFRLMGLGSDIHVTIVNIMLLFFILLRVSSFFVLLLIYVHVINVAISVYVILLKCSC